MKKATPRPVYGCANERCREEFSWPADDLVWWDGATVEADDGETCLSDNPRNAGWWCSQCTGDMVDIPYTTGNPTLEKELDRRMRHRMEADRELTAIAESLAEGCLILARAMARMADYDHRCTRMEAAKLAGLMGTLHDVEKAIRELREP